MFDFLSSVTSNVGKGFSQILTKNCDSRDDYPVHLSHFHPYTKFDNIEGYTILPGHSYACEVSYSVDTRNCDKYWQDDPNITRLKCFGLIVATPIIHAMGLVFNIANRIVKMVTLAHFWHSSSDHYSCSEKCWSLGKDLLVIVSSPLIYIFLELSAVYGLFLPNDGKKLYATFERCAYGQALLAPCFQPDATKHLGGGVLGQKNEW